MMLSFLVALIASATLWVTGWITIPSTIKANTGINLTFKQTFCINLVYFTTRIMVLWPVFYFVLPLFLGSK